jgi:TolA-binding protein
MTADAAAFIRAVVHRNGQALNELGGTEPISTLVWLDATMRGLVFGLDPMTFEALANEDPTLRRWLQWLLDQDRGLRRSIGWSQQEADLAVLRAAYRAGDLALVVGAGVSMAAGMPGWDDLALEMIHRALHYGTPEHRRELHEQLRESPMKGPDDGGTIAVGGNLFIGPRDKLDQFLDHHLATASPTARERLQWAKRELGKKSGNRSAALRAAGEEALAVFGDRLFDELRRVLFDRTLYRTGIHPAIAAMVRPKDESVPRTPRVFQILTYNFDDLLETAIREAGHESWAYLSKAGQADVGGIRPGKPFGDINKPGAVDIYHLHGFVPAPRGVYAFAPVQDVDLVFTESQYRAHYGEDASWTTQVQRAMFGNAPNLFLGSSLEDQDAVKQLTTAHERRPGWFNFAVMQLPENARQRREQLAGQDLENLSHRYQAMGIRVLWIAEFDEIPGLLASITDAEVEDHSSRLRLPLGAWNTDGDPAALHDVAIALAKEGDLEGARARFDAVIRSAPSKVAARASRNLGVLLAEHNEFENAKAAFRAAADSGEADVAARACIDLGLLALREQDQQAADQLFQRAVDLGGDEAKALLEQLFKPDST